MSFAVRAALRDRITSIDLVRSEGGELTVLPGTGAVLGLQLVGRVRGDAGLLSTAGVTGIAETARRYAYEPATTSILVRFTPDGAGCLGVPASELTGSSVGLDELWSAREASELRERVLEAQTSEAQIERVQDAIARRPFERDAQLSEAIRRLAQGDEVRVVADAVGLGERQLERRMRERVGASPKRFASLARLERAVALVRQNVPLTRAALEAGYYDQSHFIRDFQRATGTSPGAFFRDGMSGSSNRG